MSDTTKDDVKEDPKEESQVTTEPAELPAGSPTKETFPPADGEDDEFGDFGDFDDSQPLEDDEFGDFDDFEAAEDMPQEDAFVEAQESPHAEPSSPLEYEEYVSMLENDASLDSIAEYVGDYLGTLFGSPSSQVHVASPSSLGEDPNILCTPCSVELWDKLSRDSVFYNPITGSIGQFQWTRSETNRAYLNALGVTINYDEKMNAGGRGSKSPMMNGTHRRPQSHIDTNDTNRTMSMAEAEKRSSASHVRSASLSGMSTQIRHSEDVSPPKKVVEEEPELDIDIAKAYCELTEDTIRIFPDEKLQAMVVELNRLQRQASEYLGYLLDQREQLMMDAETYNDLISCIVGHAQRLREQNTKDASPAMVNRKKKGGGLNVLRRKQTSGATNTHSVSMGGGVVGVKQPKKSNTLPKTTSEGRRSM